jgi:hypothetical protein
MSASFAENLRKNPILGYGLAGGVLCLALVVYLTSGGEENPSPTHVWFIDLNDGKLFPVKQTDAQYPPVAAPSGQLRAAQGPCTQGGPAGVRAYQFACGECSQPRFLSYFEAFTPEAQNLFKSGDSAKLISAEGMEIKTKGLWVKPDGGEWMLDTDPRRAKILPELRAKCGDKPMVECYP